LQRKPANRLGLRGGAEVKAHPWFNDFNWQDLYEKKMVPPFKPKVTMAFYLKG
jgi:serum/glucocorticoid-regulated kinase 2